MALKRDKYDTIFSELVRERANWCCESCGRDFSNNRASLHCSHINGRRHTATRWHPLNALAHCVGCHRRLGEEPIQFSRHAEYEYGVMTIEQVSRAALHPMKIKPWQKEELYQHYKQELVRLKQLRITGVLGRIEFTAPDWYQQNITLRMGEAA
ncbi:hypothetical protein L2106_17710 [Citrobacter portucalensis]|uniref:hypothetical protein n=1 Tax=Citrobacter portucalensis TaxID=1639133 RepID=UPI0023B3481F|nr:hypothetical protein [Citrobacter portucalensis]MDE9575227.1 hypothetical protein [Citrobacter portucalensis]MDE9648519.1 hypothetical protein [Citrobacter portucalensis]MEB2741401.1 hypothetical protein [Citrobacter portucalensis]